MIPYGTTLFGPEYWAPFYRFIPDSNPDPNRLFWFRIGSGSGQKFGSGSDPQSLSERLYGVTIMKIQAIENLTLEHL
jgi:hypothetical protein